MKTFRKLMTRFERMHKGYHVFLDTFSSYRGNYQVAITDPDTHFPTYYTFISCDDFRVWMDNVIFD